ncbi:hypothetical protein M0812_20545 [Anaeramoeba flamelloides]|uniref:MRH domain-containing protein n=1 Tax=Anaeramoeba flamelloides TaxID=1746091 RepID=A0AAV7YS35_9EUKA|nr:hypothetical protein M0812_20545 [Anaeramoeba flamelloides]
MKKLFGLYILFFLFVFLTFGEECTEKDYGAVFTECDTQSNTRKVAYYWYEPKTCTGNLNESFVETDCDCVLQDYKIEYSQCEDGSRKKTYVKETDCVDGENPPTENVSCECVEEDYEFILTDCVDGLRDLVYVWKSPKKCEGGVELPSNELDFDCDIECEPGYFLPIGETTCQPCKAGTFSVGSGFKYDEWEEWPSSHFTTFCEKKEGNEEECSGWELGGSFIVSNNSKVDKTNSTLEYWDNFFEDENSISFKFSVDGEKHFDGLYFEIDGEVQHGFDCNVYPPETLSFNISKGIHTFRWVYSKDYSLSKGEDQAKIYSITIKGNKYAPTECDVCLQGTSSSDTASECYECPRNTYADQKNMSECLACDDTEYANPGSSKCYEREPCAEGDWESTYSECNSERKRTRYWNLIEPVICDKTRGVTKDDKPDEPGQECRECNPGEHQVEDANGSGETIYVCEFCPNGQSRPDGEPACVACESGTAAVNARYFQNFEEFPPEFTTSCTGSCGTDGWRKFDNYLDSGFGHLGVVSSLLTYEFETDDGGEIEIIHSLSCVDDSGHYWNSDCGVTFYVDGYGVEGYSSSNYEDKQTVLAFGDSGNHTVTIKFWKDYTSANETNTDRLRLSFLKVSGVTIGGADSCSNCSAGQYSLGNTNKCTKCEMGNFNDQEGQSTCDLCEKNTYNRNLGQTQCLECGHRTTSEPGSSDCDNHHCVFELDEDIKFNLSGLASPHEMVGPITDGSAYEFYINLCYLNASQDVCQSKNGHIINSRACQRIDTQYHSYVWDLGSNIDVLELPHSYNLYDIPINEQGVLFRLIDGGGGRITNITILCDIQQGVGQLGPDGVIEDDDHKKEYKFIWKTQYGCRMCLESDYTHYFTACENNQRMKKYQWISNPKTCYGGAELPSDEVAECEGSQLCPSGTWAEGSDCINCTVGRFSTGQDIIYTNANLDNIVNDGDIEHFSSHCTGSQCTPWTYDSEILKSGVGENSVLTITKNFVNVGEIAIKSNSYLIHADNDQVEKFVIKIDNEQVYSIESPFIHSEFIERTFKINFIGTHVIKLIVQNSNHLSHGIHINYLHFKNVTRSSQNCDPCPKGYYSPEIRSSECQICNANTFSGTTGSDSCEACDTDTTYSYRGSDSCSDKIACNMEDYHIEWEACNTTTRKRVGKYKFYQPQICTGSLPEDIDADCPKCKPGSFLNNANECELCPDGFYSDKEDASSCVKSEMKFAAIKSLNFDLFNVIGDQPNTNRYNNGDDADGDKYFDKFIQSNVNIGNKIDDDQNAMASDYLNDYTTSCVGNGCGFSSGWRFRDDYMDSGIGNNNGGVYDSIITFNTPVEVIEKDIGYFEIETLLHNSEASLIILLNDEPILEFNTPSADYETTKVKLESGSYILSFIYRQYKPETISRSFVKRFSFYGTKGGSSTNAVPCSNGTFSDSDQKSTCESCQPGSYSFSNDGGVEECTLCPINEFSDQSGLSQCFKCGVGTSSNNDLGSTYCVNQCSYSPIQDQDFDFSLITQNEDVVKIPNENGMVYLSLCSPITDNSICQENNSFICQNSESLGKILNFSYPLPIEKYPKETGLVIEFLPELIEPNSEEFQFDHIHATEDGDGANDKKTTIYMICDQSAGIGNPIILTGDDRIFMENSNTEIEWKSLYGCRTCNDPDDFKEIKGSCIDGKRTSIWSHAEDCWAKESKENTETSCSEVQVQSYWVYIAIGIFAFIIVSLGVVCYQKRSLKVKYTKLSKANKDAEMGVFGDEKLFNSNSEIEMDHQNTEKSSMEKSDFISSSENQNILKESEKDDH